MGLRGENFMVAGDAGVGSPFEMQALAMAEKTHPVLQRQI